MLIDVIAPVSGFFSPCSRSSFHCFCSSQYSACGAINSRFTRPCSDSTPNPGAVCSRGSGGSLSISFIAIGLVLPFVCSASSSSTFRSAHIRKNPVMMNSNSNAAKITMPFRPMMFCSYGCSKSTNDFSCFVDPIFQFGIWDLRFGICFNPQSQIQHPKTSMSTSVLDRILEDRIHHRHKRTFHQLDEKIPDPNPADGDRGNEIHPPNNKGALCASMCRDPWARADK